jgi:DNA gyrase subunit A
MFTPTGRVYSEVVYKLSTSDTVGIGVSLRRLVKNDNLEIVSAVSAGANTKASLIFVTKNGTVKQTKLADYFGASQGGSAIKLKTDDVLAGVVSLRSDRDKFLIYTKNGMSILFDAKDVTTTSRSTAGVNGIRLEEGDEVMGACVVSPSDTHIITIADRGEMKRISLETSLTDMKRGTGGVALVSKSETLNAVFAVNPKVTSIKYMVGSEVKEIVVEDIPVKTRVSNGDKKINALRGEKPIRVIE